MALAGAVWSFPYRPSHDPQKIMRASLATSCLRGEVNVWQFQGGEGVTGKEIRRQPRTARRGLVRAGVFHRVCREPKLRGEEHVRPMQAHERDYQELGLALANGHTDMVEWFLCGTMQAFEHGLHHPRREVSATGWQRHMSPPSPLPFLLQCACHIGWEWGRHRIEQIVDESNDPDAIAMRVSGDYAVVLGASCARAGSACSLQWVKHFAQIAREGTMTAVLSQDPELAGLCTLAVAEWIWGGGCPRNRDVAQHVLAATAGRNWPVVEWLVRSGGPIDTSLPFLDAAAAGDLVAVMRFFGSHGLDCCTAQAGSNAAGLGSLPVLEWLHAERPEHVHEAHLQDAVRSGDVDKVHFLVQQCRFGWTEESVQLAVRHGHVQLLEWARAHGLSFSPRCVELSQCWGDHKTSSDLARFLLAFAPEARCTYKDLEQACWYGLPLVEAIHARFPELLSAEDPQDSTLLASAALSNHPESLGVVEFLVRQGAQMGPGGDAITIACATNNVRLAQFLLRTFSGAAAGGPPKKAMWQASAYGALEAVEWLHRDHGLRPAPHEAVQYGRLGVLEFFVKHCGVSGPMPKRCLQDCVNRNQLHMLEYLVAHDMGGPGLIKVVPALARRPAEWTAPWPLKAFLLRTCQSPKT